jgi:hypothetical protein
MVIAMMPNIAAPIEKLPPSSPVTTTLPPRANRRVANLQGFVRPNEITDSQHTAAGRRHHGFARIGIGWVVGRRSTCSERGVALLRIDVGDDRRGRKERACYRETHHADPSQTDKQNRTAFGTDRVPLERRVSGKA